MPLISNKSSSFWLSFLLGKQECCLLRLVVFSVFKTNIYFVVFDIVVKNKSNVVKRGLYSCQLNDTRHYSGQNVVQQIELHHQACFALVML